MSTPSSQPPVWQKPRPCSDCGEMSEPGVFHVAVHDCKAGEWDYITFTAQGVAALEALADEGA